jgi:hypothetical protein
MGLSDFGHPKSAVNREFDVLSKNNSTVPRICFGSPPGE